jgi:exodeoxyribonuclease V beta subunit
MTRAVYMGIIIHKPKDNCGIKTFLDGAIAKEYFKYKENLESDKRRYNDKKEEVDKTPKIFSNSEIESKWSNYSFSMLSKYEPLEKPEPVELTDEYDRFVFDEFPKGALAGNFMHYLFENADFTNNDFSVAIAKALSRYNSVFESARNELEGQLSEMLSHVFNATIPDESPFVLSQITEANKLPEMGFNFNLSNFSTGLLHRHIPHINLDREGDIQGMMTGFIDLLFEHNGKFYILDWKSNYLGNALDDYTPAKLEAAMQKSNYHLQYLIYTVATKLYLQNCIHDFDYNRHFGGIIYVYARACRKNGNTGIYFTKPEKQMIEDLEGLLVDKALMV